MADLAGRIMPAAKELPVDDDRCADAGANDDISQIARAARRACAGVQLAQRGGLGVVLDADRQACGPRTGRP